MWRPCCHCGLSSKLSGGLCQPTLRLIGPPAFVERTTRPRQLTGAFDISNRLTVFTTLPLLFPTQYQTDCTYFLLACNHSLSDLFVRLPLRSPVLSRGHFSTVDDR